jgi:hypothetical protein
MSQVAGNTGSQSGSSCDLAPAEGLESGPALEDQPRPGALRSVMGVRRIHRRVIFDLGSRKGED